jgi:hypothetical protein
MGVEETGISDALRVRAEAVDVEERAPGEDPVTSVDSVLVDDAFAPVLE